MSETAQFQVERNRPCLEHCLGKLVLLLKNVNLKKLDITAVSDPGVLPSSSLTERWLNINGIFYFIFIIFNLFFLFFYFLLFFIYFSIFFNIFIFT